MRNLAEAVFKLAAELHHVGFALHVVELLIQAYSLTLLRHIGCRKQKLHVALYGAVGHILWLIGVALCHCIVEGVGELLGAQLKHCLLEYSLVGFIAQVGNEAALFGSEQVAGSAYVEVLHGYVYAAAKLRKTLYRLKPSPCHRCERLAGRNEQIAECLARATPHTAA